MKIVVYGATGMVGSQIAEAALARGHEVTAVSRAGADVAGATAVAADIIDTDTLVALAADADAVVVAIPTDRTGGPTEPIIKAHQDLIAAHPATRLLVVGGAGSLSVGDSLRVDAPGFPDAYKPGAKAFTAILDDYRASSGLDWTVVFPSPVIAPGSVRAMCSVRTRPSATPSRRATSPTRSSTSSRRWRTRVVASRSRPRAEPRREDLFDSMKAHRSSPRRDRCSPRADRCSPRRLGEC